MKKRYVFILGILLSALFILTACRDPVTPAPKPNPENKEPGETLPEGFRGIYVSPDGLPDNDGSSWEHAVTIEKAFAMAAGNTGSEINYMLLLEGSYDAANTLSMRNGLTIVGGFDGSEKGIIPAALGKTILSRSGYEPLFLNSGIDATAVIRNVTIRKVEDSGIRNKDGSSPSIMDCTFLANTGGGIFNQESSNPAITNCQFLNNMQGIINTGSSPSITNCNFTGNRVGVYNGEDSSSRISDSVFSLNKESGISCYDSSPAVSGCTVSGSVYGMVISGGGSPSIENCNFNNNEIGMAISAWEGSPGIRRSIFTENTNGIDIQFGFSNIINCTISGNYGDGISIRGGSLDMGNCTITGNYANGISAKNGRSIIPRGNIIAGNGNKIKFFDVNIGDNVNINEESRDNLLGTANDTGISTNFSGKLSDIFVTGSNKKPLLKDNGGTTRTMMIKPVDALKIKGDTSSWNDGEEAGTSLVPAVDQRGFSRGNTYYKGAVDPGAVK